MYFITIENNNKNTESKNLKITLFSNFKLKFKKKLKLDLFIHICMDGLNKH